MLFLTPLTNLTPGNPSITLSIYDRVYNFEENETYRRTNPTVVVSNGEFKNSPLNTSNSGTALQLIVERVEHIDVIPNGIEIIGTTNKQIIDLMIFGDGRISYTLLPHEHPEQIPDFREEIRLLKG